MVLCASIKADEVRVEKCRLCSPPACRIKDQYEAAFPMTKTAKSDEIKVREYIGHNPTNQRDNTLVASFTTLGGVNTNGSVTITNILNRYYAVSVYYAQQGVDMGKYKQGPINVDYLIGKNVACYRDMPRGMHTKDVQSVKALVKHQ